MTLNPPPYSSKYDDYGTTRKTRRHGSYYFEEGNLVIKVGDTLFKVWDASFRYHSKIFCEMFQIPKNPLNLIYQPGVNDEHPLELEDIDVFDFERFLWILYPPVIGEYQAESCQDWIAVLNLASRWGFKDIRALAIRQLSTLEIDPVEKVVLEHRFEIDREWAYTSYIALCNRKTPLSVVEAKKLGPETTAMVAIARERLESGWIRSDSVVTSTVKEVFDLKGPER